MESVANSDRSPLLENLGGIFSARISHVSPRNGEATNPSSADKLATRASFPISFIVYCFA